MKPLRCAIYCRVSTDAQERDGTSLESQARECLGYVDRLGGMVITVVREAASGYTLDRSGLSEVRRLIRERQVDAFVCYAVDRWSRQQNHLGILFDELETAGVRLE